ncbi:hypothetical protein [Chlamydia felis Fe/C-56]|uniref:Uncharacterized protein n=1 Tax=Chlamydia felis (strain Fe/C-56) TaxID=264202 RepID=Q255F9_CHLFF|nr:hypothetical protein [Chlamydia felis Fe/C-56]
MHRHNEILILPRRTVQPEPKLNPRRAMCKLNLINLIVDILKLDRMNGLLGKIGITRLSMFVYHGVLMFITIVYISISCVLRVLCMLRCCEGKYHKSREHCCL